MPCHDPTNYEAEAANEKVQMFTRNLCRIFQDLDAREQLDFYLTLCPELGEWWKEHKKTDGE